MLISIITLLPILIMTSTAPISHKIIITLINISKRINSTIHIPLPSILSCLVIIMTIRVRFWLAKLFILVIIIDEYVWFVVLSGIRWAIVRLKWIWLGA